MTLRSVCAFVAMLAVVPYFTNGPSAEAAPPWQRVKLFRRVEARAEKSYSLTDSQGPWMVMAVTFIGEDAQTDADELVYELRKRHKLPAYTHRVRYDFSDPIESYDRRGASQSRRYQRDHEYDEVAVLVGDYPAVDDPEGQATLSRIKYMQPESLTKDQGEVNRPLAALRDVQRQIHGKLVALQEKKRPLRASRNREKKDRGPMGHAFLTTNPLLPREYYAPKGVDPLITELNKRVDDSLLECEGRYSIRVATFTGKVFIKPNDIRAIEEGKHVESNLEQAAEKAHILTEALRKKGWEAYEYHDRNSSMVTVGSFNSLGTPGPNGSLDMSPAVQKIIDTFGAGQSNVAGQAIAGASQLKSVAGIPFDPKPQPIEVPRVSVSAPYGRNLFGMR